jgi:hypothetical protein
MPYAISHLIAGAALLLSPNPHVSPADDPVLQLAFDKAAAEEGVWTGTVSVDGAEYGQLRTELVSAEEDGSILNVVFDWIISGTPDGARDFTARLNGTLNLETGRALMEGHVTKGYRKGAFVQEEGRLVDAETSRFQGTIHVRPAE